MDKVDSLNYHQLEDNVQPQGRKGRFSGKNSMKFIPSTTNKYCLVLYNYPHLQLLHWAFICGEWVYASASRAGVGDYWMRIPLLHIITLMKDLFSMSGRKKETWSKVGRYWCTKIYFLNRSISSSTQTPSLTCRWTPQGGHHGREEPPSYQEQYTVASFNMPGLRRGQ